MTAMDAVWGLIGGACIGLAATLLHLLLGRVAGISGIVEAALFDRESEWRWGFIGGLCAVGAIWSLNAPDAFADTTGTSIYVAIAAGLCVGFGTRLGSGCTSGHGVCGLSRFSKRAAVATLIFMGAAVITVYLAGHLSGAR